MYGYTKTLKYMILSNNYEFVKDRGNLTILNNFEQDVLYVLSIDKFILFYHSASQELSFVSP